MSELASLILGGVDLAAGLDAPAGRSHHVENEEELEAFVDWARPLPRRPERSLHQKHDA